MRYYITTFPGIEEIAKDELSTKWPSARIASVLKGKNNSLITFESPDDGEEFLRLKISEDFYVLLAEVELLDSKTDLEIIKDAAEKARNFDLALSLHRKVYKKKFKRTTYRVVAQSSSDYHEYRRVDAQRAVEKGVRDRYNKKWKLVEDDSQLEVWIHLIGKKAVIGLRISDRTMRHRTYKFEHLPASLRPTIAHALVWVSNIEADDVFLDPMCGAGTILIERANAGKYRQLLGGDIRPEAVDVALTNIGIKYKPIEIKAWDATKLPLDNNSVNKIVSNLPFGRKIGTHDENAILYKEFFQEAGRVLRNKGKMVILSSERNLVKNCVENTKGLKIDKEHKNVVLLGYNADIFVINKEQNQ